ncbi:glycosyl transferase, partial [Proteus mirabilis]
YKLTNLDINFPYKVYDPIADTLILPKLISSQNCATAIIEIMNNYTIFSQNAIEWSRETTDYNLFIQEFESTIRDSQI